jgi:EmrB/QacA subfamily drug resistance transporter
MIFMVWPLSCSGWGSNDRTRYCFEHDGTLGARVLPAVPPKIIEFLDRRYAMTPIGNGPCDTAVIRAAPSLSPCSREDARWILAATILGSGMAFIDGTVVNVALPVLQKDLNAGLADLQWVVESYALLLAALLLVGGAAGDRFGRRRVFAIGVALFAAASAGCGIAVNINQLIAARAVQGLGAALLVPGSLAIISASFDARSRGAAIGTWSGATAMTAALGPVLGGWLIDHLSWRAAFLINLPIAAIVLLITLTRVPESRDDNVHGSLDWQGAALATVGLGALVYALIESSNRGWAHPVILVALVLGVAALAAFAAVEARQEAPMMPLGLFRSRSFLGANIVTLLVYAALGGGLFFVPLDLIQVRGYSATEAGAALLPLILMMAVLSRWAGGLVFRHGSKPPLVIGPLVAGAGYALLALPGTGGSYWTTFFPGMIVLGLGMTVTVAPLTTTVMNSVEQGAVGAASGINNAASRVASLIAIAVLGIVFAQVFNHRLDQGLRRIALPAAALASVDEQRPKLAAIELPSSVDPRSRAAARQVIAESFVSGFRWVMMISALLAVAGAASALMLLDSEAGERRASS